MNISIHYLVLIGRSVDCVSDLLADKKLLEAFTRAHNFASDFEMLLASIEGRPEAEVMQLGLREYQYALYAAAVGNYRHATISLRLFLELSLSTVHFSAYELHLREWLNRRRDIVWKSLVDPSTGVFAHNFIEAFNPGLENLGKQYSTIADALYRECSEYVHGNRHTHGDAGADQALGFDRAEVLGWIDRADAARLSVLFAFACRYLGSMAPERRARLEYLMLDCFGDIAAIRALYD